jgi:3-oxoacyl-[acyl-carrier protein] reductase
VSAFSLKGKSALITGGARGIGAAISRCFAEAGARVVIANRTSDRAETLARTLCEEGYDVSAAPLGDLSRKRIAGLVDTAAASHGLDIVVHNAGGCTWSALENMSEEALEDAFNVNLKPCFWLAQASIPHMRRRGGGRILVTSSVTGPRSAMANAAHYSQ